MKEQTRSRADEIIKADLLIQLEARKDLKKAERNRVTILVIITCLLIDLLAFTIILPLFPRIIAHYSHTSTPTSLFKLIEAQITTLRLLLTSRARLDVILFGGLLGSLYSFLQFLISPLIGRSSDVFGRRRVLLLSVIGNLLSILLWIYSSTFEVFLLSRIVAGLTEGNVQISIAMISDLSTPKERVRAFGAIGICFAIAFTLGPPLGAYLTTTSPNHFYTLIYPVFQRLIPFIPLPLTALFAMITVPNKFSMPAIFAFFLVLVEFVILYLCLSETLESLDSSKDVRKKGKDVSKIGKDDSKDIKNLSLIHFLFLFAFSGLEFTLTFLTYDKFAYTNTQQGYLLSLLGLTASTIQATYTRRQRHTSLVVVQGIISCAIGLFFIGFFKGQGALYLGVLFLGFTSGSVVTCLTALASIGTSTDMGSRLGVFRSYGQLGRCIGPLFCCSLYWAFGSLILYTTSALYMTILAMLTSYMLGVGKKSISSV